MRYEQILSWKNWKKAKLLILLNPLKLPDMGAYSRYCRTQKGLSQKTIANSIHYDLRSLQRVEKGEQEPKVTTAVKLVAAVEMPPGQFFEWLGFFFIPYWVNTKYAFNHLV